MTSSDTEEIVRVMANAAWNGSNELKITHNQFDGIARKMLDVALSEGLVVLRDALEVVGWAHKLRDLHNWNLTVYPQEESEFVEVVPVYRLAGSPTPQAPRD